MPLLCTFLFMGSTVYELPTLQYASSYAGCFLFKLRSIYPSIFVLITLPITIPAATWRSVDGDTYARCASLYTHTADSISTQPGIFVPDNL